MAIAIPFFLTSVRVKRVLGHRAGRGAPKLLLCRARRARHSKGFSLSQIHVFLAFQPWDALAIALHTQVRPRRFVGTPAAWDLPNLLQHERLAPYRCREAREAFTFALTQSLSPKLGEGL